MAADSSSQPHTGTPTIDGLLSGVKWNTLSLSYGFPDARSDYEANYFDAAIRQVHMLHAAQRGAIDGILTQISGLTSLSFTQFTGASVSDADLRFAQSRAADPAYAYYPANHASFPEGGDSFFHGGADFDNVRLGSYGFSTFLHETGHTLGLKHGHERDGGFAALPRRVDSLEFSVMTYRAFVGAPINGPFDNEKYGFPQSYMMLDIAALQEMYGADYTHNDGDSIYTFGRKTGEMFVDGIGQGRPGANRIFLTIWDGGGQDTYDFSNYHSNLIVRLDPGSWSLTNRAQLALLDQATHHYARANVFNALLHDGDTASLIENAIGGSGHDRLIGNQADNELTGNGRGDKISGHDGADHLLGGPGSDRLWGGADADVFVFTGLHESRVGKQHDVIKDFSTLQGDKIDLTALEDATATSFHFIGASNFSAAGDMHYTKSILSIDVDGDGRADFQIKVAGLHSEADFILNP
jgi:Ca2+-binding RTX toxin-like protein